jgi:hypothetical protein
METEITRAKERRAARTREDAAGQASS